MLLHICMLLRTLFLFYHSSLYINISEVGARFIASANSKNCRFSNVECIMHFSFPCPFLSTTLPLQSRMRFLSHFTREASVWRALTDFETEVCPLLSKSTCVFSDCSGSWTFHFRRFALLKMRQVVSMAYINLDKLHIAGMQVKG